MSYVNKIEQAAELIAGAQCVAALTGAGVSTPSGIPDYRGSSGAYWRRYDAKDFEYQRFIASADARQRFWQMGREFYEMLVRSEPNPAHTAFAELEKLGKLSCLITQNVDGLHEKAGVSKDKVIELHGNFFTVSCLDCKRSYSTAEVYQRLLSNEKVPQCIICQGILKPDTIIFGEPMPEQETQKAIEGALKADLFMAVGSSLIVQPAAHLCAEAKDNGAKLVIINYNPTNYDRCADVVIYGEVAEVMGEIVLNIKNQISNIKNI